MKSQCHKASAWHIEVIKNSKSPEIANERPSIRFTVSDVTDTAEFKRFISFDAFVIDPARGDISPGELVMEFTLKFAY